MTELGPVQQQRAPGHLATAAVGPSTRGHRDISADVQTHTVMHDDIVKLREKEREGKDMVGHS